MVRCRETSVSATSRPMRCSKLREQKGWNLLNHLVGTDEQRGRNREAECLRRLEIDRKSTRLNSSHIQKSRMPSSA